MSEVDPIWGARGWLCARCRFARRDGEACCDRPAVDLRDPVARDQLHRRIWSYDPRSVWYSLKKWRLRRAARRVLGKLRYLLGAPYGSWPQRYRPPPTPPLEGIARGAGAAPPFGGAPCLAYGLELRSHRHRIGPIMLRDAASAGFVLELDDGRSVRVPPGAVMVVMDRAPLEPITSSAWRTLLQWLHVSPSPEPRPVVPHDEVLARRVITGDRVALWAELGPDDTLTGYRDTLQLVVRPPIWLSARARG